MKKIVLVLLCSLTAGCVGFYQQPAAQAPHATLDAVGGPSMMTDGGVQMYWAYYDVGCNDTAQTGVLGTRKGAARERFLLIPERRVYLNVMSSGGATKAGATVLRHCANVASFIPVAGVTYQVSQDVPETGCRVEILDQRTGRPPESFRAETVQGQCSP